MSSLKGRLSKSRTIRFSAAWPHMACSSTKGTLNGLPSVVRQGRYPEGKSPTTTCKPEQLENLRFWTD
jgi:hypothetical protein